MGLEPVCPRVRSVGSKGLPSQTQDDHGLPHRPRPPAPARRGVCPPGLGPGQPGLSPPEQPQPGAIGWLLWVLIPPLPQAPIPPHRSSVSNMIAKEELPKHLFQVMYLTFGNQGRASPHHAAQLLIDIPFSRGLTPNSCRECVSGGLGFMPVPLPQDISSLFSGPPHPPPVSQGHRCAPSTSDAGGPVCRARVVPLGISSVPGRSTPMFRGLGQSLPHWVRSQAGRWQVLDSGPI